MHSRASYPATLMIAMALWFGAGMHAPPTRAATGDIEDGTMVDCMLPGQIQRLNNDVTIMGARHPIRTTRADCHVRGGEYQARPVKSHRKTHRTADTIKSSPTK